MSDATPSHRLKDMLGKLPFLGRIFWKVLVIVAVLMVVGWIVTVKAFGYVMQSQDYPGSAISGLIFVYLVHLWLLPEEPPADGA